MNDKVVYNLDYPENSEARRLVNRIAEQVRRYARTHDYHPPACVFLPRSAVMTLWLATGARDEFLNDLERGRLTICGVTLRTYNGDGDRVFIAAEEVRA